MMALIMEPPSLFGSRSLERKVSCQRCAHWKCMHTIVRSSHSCRYKHVRSPFVFRFGSSANLLVLVAILRIHSFKPVSVFLLFPPSTVRQLRFLSRCSQ